MKMLMTSGSREPNPAIRLREAVQYPLIHCPLQLYRTEVYDIFLPNKENWPHFVYSFIC